MNPQHLSFERRRFKWASICSRRFLVDDGDDEDDDDDNDEGSGDCDVRVDDEGLSVEEDDDDDLPLVYCKTKCFNC